jgi:hypothetical protein
MSRIHHRQCVLDDEGDRRSPDESHLALGQREQILTGEDDLPVHDFARRRNHAKQGHAECALAAARLPDQPDDLAGVDP